MDITMKKMDGITGARLIKAQYPNTLIVGCSAHTQDYNVYAMKRVCAFEVILKKEDAVKLSRTLVSGDRESYDSSFLTLGPSSPTTILSLI